MSRANDDQGSTLLLDEYFESGDDRFIDQLRNCRSPKKLAALADRWRHDPRPWAREQIFAYLDRPMDVPGHHPLVKRLFKATEASADDELMGAFLVAFDRLVRRRRKTKGRWDGQSRTFIEEEALRTPRNVITPQKRGGKNPGPGEDLQRPCPKDGRLFSYHTRYYLRRRVWRHFRRAGYQPP